MSKKILILDWGERYRKYVLEAGRELGLQMYLVLTKKKPQALTFVEDILVIPTLYDNPLLHIDEIVAYIDKHKIQGVLTHEDDLMELSALVSEHAGLAGASFAAIHISNEKWETRKRLQAVGIEDVAYRCVSTLEEAKEALPKIGFPAIMKPIISSGGHGVVKIEEHTDLAQAWACAYKGTLAVQPEFRKILIEEFMPGQLVSLESVVVEGEPFTVTATDGLQSYIPVEGNMLRIVYEGLIIPSLLPGEMIEEMTSHAHAAIRALGIETGIVHTELKQTKRGCRIVEVNPRLGGVFIPELVRHAVGYDLTKAAMQMALGEKPNQQILWQRGASLLLLRAQSEGIVTDSSGLEAARNSPSVVRAEVWAQKGDYIIPPHKDDIEQRLGYVFTEHRSPFEALEAAKKAIKHISITISANDEK